MTGRSMLRTLTATAALVALLAPTTTLAAGDGEYADLVHDRHENFEAIGDAFRVIRDQLRGDAPVDFDAQAEAAAVIVGFSTEIPSWFPAGSGPQDGYETDALAAIWEDWDRFAEIADSFPARVSGLEAAIAGGDMGEVGEAFMTVGGTCKECHDNFRAE